MKLRQLFEDGRIVKGVNTTQDVGVNQTSIEAAKFGNTVDKDGRPPVINSKAAKNSTPNKLANLGLAESTYTNENLEEGPIGKALGTAALAGTIAAAGQGAYHLSNLDAEPETTKQVIQIPAKDKKDLSKIEIPKKQDAEKKVKQKQEVSYQPLTGNKNELTLVKHAQNQGIKGVELAAFMSQMAHESENFTDMIEDISHERAAKKYGKGKIAKILGNKSENDAMRFKGRGYIQLTGRWNYEWMEKELGIDLTSSWSAAQKAADPDIAADIAVAYWKKRVQPKVDNYADVKAVTKRINSGLHGLDARKARFVKIASNMGITENFADGKKKGKSRPGRVKRAGASCKGSVTSLRKRAKNSSGEKAKMYHWCANMKSGRKKG
jgi:predicted chitinase